MNNLYKRFALLVTLSASCTLGFAATCSKTMNNNMVNDNLKIPANAVCVLNGSMINGNIEALTGATLILNAATVNGNIEAKKAKVVKLNKSTIQGNVELEQTSSAIVIDKSVIDGDLSCSGNVASKGIMNVINGDIEGKCR